MPGALDLHFDFISPYAYLAWTQIHALAGRHGRTVRPRPTLFAALLNHSGALGPAEIPLKRTYMFKDIIRTARVLGVPLEPPPAHPFNPLLALRVAGLDMPDDLRRRVIDALYRATWGGGDGVEDPERVARAVIDAGGDAPALLAAAAEPAAKQRLRETTDAAIAAGVFGVPTAIADGELFWGVDALSHLERFLGGAFTISERELARFLAIPPSASRR